MERECFCSFSLMGFAFLLFFLRRGSIADWPAKKASAILSRLHPSLTYFNTDLNTNFCRYLGEWWIELYFK